MSDPATSDSATPDSAVPGSAVPLWVLSLAGALVLVVLVGFLMRNGDAGSSPAEPVDPVDTIDTVDVMGTVEPVDVVDTDDEVEVCDTTEYEGCPARWEYLWADEADPADGPATVDSD